MNLKKTEFQTNRTSLDENLPSAPSQIVDEVDAALQKLAEAQQDDGSFGGGTSDVQAKLVATSMAGLALLSAHDSYVEKYVGHVEKCLQFIAAQFADENAQPFRAFDLRLHRTISCGIRNRPA